MERPAEASSRFRTVSIGAGTVGLIVGIVVLAGWAIGNTTLTSIVTGLATMKVNTALSITLLGGALVIAAARPSASRGSTFVTAIPLAIAGVTIAEYAANADFGIDNLVIRDTASATLPGRMSLATAVVIVSLGLGIIAATFGRPVASQAFAQIGLVIVAVALVGYLYNVQDLYRFGPYASIALHTAASLTVIGFGVLLLRPNDGLLRRVLDPGPGGTLIRALLVPSLFVPIALGYLVLIGSRAGLYSLEFAVGLLVMVLILLLRAFVLRTANAVDAMDRDRERIAQDASRSAERQRVVMQTVTDAIITVGIDSRILYANPATERTFGYSQDELIGRSLPDLMPERYRTQHLAGIARYVETGVRSIDWDGTELVGRNRSGEEFPVEVSFADAGSGEDRTFTGTIRDISARKRLEAQLLQSRRLESVGRLAGGIAHDFNNVLTAILGFSRLMIDELPPGNREREKAEEIEDAANRASLLVRQLLAFGRQQVLRPEVVDLGEVVRGISPMLERLIGADVEMEVPPADGGWFVEADRGQLEQVIVNLAINARDAMPRGGRLTIEASEVDLDSDHVSTHPGVTPGPHVVLAVSDTGTGMDTDTRNHIFEPFFTTKDPGSGTGLGLATVYGIVLQSGGDISVYSELGKGTTFRIYLPRATRRPTVEQPKLPEPASGSGRETILVAEDEESLRSLIKTVLERLGYTVLVASDAAAALEIARRERFDLLVSDVVMPGKSGLELADAVRELIPGARVLFMSGYTATALEGHGSFSEAESLLEKPFRPAALGIAVRRALDAER